MEPVRWKFLFHDTRARVYLVWAVLATAGFVATHYYQRNEINAAWFFISLAGLGYMFKVMPLRVKQMQKIFLAWALPIAFGMLVSFLAFKLDGLVQLISYLGVFWLVVMAVGYTLNGLVDPPGGWYFFAAGMNIVAALLCYYVDAFWMQQYLVAAVVTAWSMLYLWLFRT